MSNILLDCGTHFGQGLGEFIERFKVDSTWTIHTWEANPVTHEIFVRDHLSYLKHLGIQIESHLQAVSDHDGVITVNLETPPGEGDTGMGTSVIDLERWNPWGGTIRQNFMHTAQVPCIDFSAFVRNNFQPDDNIICKMDIEGSEYDVLEHMLTEGTLPYLKFLAVEWHSRFFTNKEEIEVRESAIQSQVEQLGVTLESWK